MRRIMAAPATPPTMPPTRTGVGGVLLPPEPPPELDVGEGAVAVAVLPLLPTPPAPRLVLDAVPDNEEADADWLRRCDDAGVDEVRVLGVETICVEDNPELRSWLLRVEVANPLRLDVPEVKAAKDSTLNLEVCEVVDCRGTELVTALDPELRLLRLENADDAADAADVVILDVDGLVAEAKVSEYLVMGKYDDLTRHSRVIAGLQLGVLCSRDL